MERLPDVFELVSHALYGLEAISVVLELGLTLVFGACSGFAHSH